MSTPDYVGLVMAEIVEAAGDPAATLQDIQERLGGLHQNGSQPQQVAIEQVWDSFLALQEQAGTAMNLAATARQMAAEMETTRDDAVQKHEKLASDIKAGNIQNPLVEGLYYDTWNEAYEQGIESSIEQLEWNGGHLSYSIAEDIISEGGIPVDDEVADQFFALMTGELEQDAGAPELDALREELAAFMTAFVGKYADLMAAREAATHER